jgi:hypothetical protein
VQREERGNFCYQYTAPTVQKAFFYVGNGAFSHLDNRKKINRKKQLPTLVKAYQRGCHQPLPT